MKKRKLVTLALAVTLCVSLESHSEESTSPGPPRWSISKESPQTLISSSTSQKIKVIIIRRATGNTNNSNVSIDIDGQALSGPLQRGGEILATGKQFKISQQPGEQTKANGTWELVDISKIDNIKISWSISAQSGNNRAIVAALSEAQDFVIDFHDLTGCSAGFMSVKVDNLYMDAEQGSDKGKIRFLPGSSVIGRGKTVELIMEGNCEGEQNLTGSFKLLPSTL